MRSPAGRTATIRYRRVADAVVVGAGIIGAAIARAAADRGATVEVVEASRPAAQTSLATFAWVNAVGKQPRAYFDLNHAGMAEHLDLVKRLGGGEWYHAGGNLEWSAAADELATRADRHRRWGYAVEIIDAAAARRLEPRARIGPDDGVAFYPDDAWVDPVVLVGRLLDHPSIAVSSGVPVQRVATGGSRAVGVELADGRAIGGGHVVVATGARTADLLRPLGFELPMRDAPGLLAVTEPVAGGPRRIVHAPGVSLRPDGGGRLLLAADDLDKRLVPSGGDLSVADAADELMARARRALAGLEGIGFEGFRVGHRALTTDGYPAIGAIPGIEAASVAVTHSGITLAPLLGRLVAGEVLDARANPVLDDYRPARFAVATPTVS